MIFVPKKSKKPTLEEVTQLFGKAHAEESDAKTRMEKYRKQFFDLLKDAIPQSKLARRTIYYEGNDPANYVATFYPKWRIIKKEVIHLDGEWRIIIEEDPTKKSWTFINAKDGQVYQRTVVESAPQIDMAKLATIEPGFFESITIQPPPPPRELKPLDELSEDERERLTEYLLPPKLTNRMDKPRKAKPEELEG